MQTPRYSLKRTLGLAPTVSPPIQTHPYSRHFGTNFVDSLVIKQQELEARYSAKNTLELLICLLATAMCLIRKDIGHITSSILVIGHIHTIPLTPERGHLVNPVTFSSPKGVLIRGAPLYTITPTLYVCSFSSLLTLCMYSP